MPNVFERLEVYQLAMELVPEVYRISRMARSSGDDDLKSQINRSVVSIPSNIAEGAASSSYKVYRKHVNIASGSAAELYTQIKVAQTLGYVTQEQANQAINKIESIQRMLNGLKNHLNRQLE